MSLWRLYRLWWEQGRSRRYPVVVKPGRLVIYADGSMCMVDWHIWTGMMKEPLAVLDPELELWEYLTRFAQPEWEEA